MAENLRNNAAAEYIVNTCAPGDLSGSELAACIAVIKAGGAVAVNSAKLRSAKLLAVARRGNQIVGVGSIKRVRTDRASGIAHKSGFAFPAQTPELGYVAVDPQHLAERPFSPPRCSAARRQAGRSICDHL